MSAWTPSLHADPHRFDAASLTEHWARLHRGDAEPLPADPALLHAWVLFHNGAFEAAAQAGLALGWAGASVANKATCVHARYVEPSETRRLGLLKEAADRAAAHQQTDPLNPAAWYWQGYALGRFSQGISVAKALAQGLGSRVKNALQKTLELAPQHADAHLALATFHAEVIDKVGSLIGGMTYGARKDTGLALYQQAIKLNPESAITLNEYANGLLMLEGEAGLEQAMRLQERAVGFEPLDALERHYLDEVRATLAE
jgi:tetratricopeptide (TPR) repeat protein